MAKVQTWVLQHPWIFDLVRGVLSLLLGLGVNELEHGRIGYLWKSRDGGKSWDKSAPRVSIGANRCAPGRAVDGRPAAGTGERSSNQLSRIFPPARFCVTFRNVRCQAAFLARPSADER